MEQNCVIVELIGHNFFMSCNNILSHSSGRCDPVPLKLHESYVLPTHAYATAAIKLSESQITSQNAFWNYVFRRIFNFKDKLYTSPLSGLLVAIQNKLINFL